MKPFTITQNSCHKTVSIPYNFVWTYSNNCNHPDGPVQGFQLNSPNSAADNVEAI